MVHVQTLLHCPPLIHLGSRTTSLPRSIKGELSVSFSSTRFSISFQGLKPVTFNSYPPPISEPVPEELRYYWQNWQRIHEGSTGVNVKVAGASHANLLSKCSFFLSGWRRCGARTPATATTAWTDPPAPSSSTWARWAQVLRPPSQRVQEPEGNSCLFVFI